jgi:hypothetical protein
MAACETDAAFRTIVRTQMSETTRALYLSIVEQPAQMGFFNTLQILRAGLDSMRDYVYMMYGNRG